MTPDILPPSHTMCMKKLKINNPSHFLYEFSSSSFLIIVQLISDEIKIGSMVRRGSVGSASACCKAGPSSILGSAPQ
jgi:hypothetical protein